MIVLQVCQYNSVLQNLTLSQKGGVSTLGNTIDLLDATHCKNDFLSLSDIHLLQVTERFFKMHILNSRYIYIYIYIYHLNTVIRKT